MTAKREAMSESAVFTKLELYESKRFSNQRDLVKAVLDENTKYSIREAKEEIQKFLKGEVKTWH